MKLLALNLFLSVEDYMLPCLTKHFIGVDCPGCGIQRSVAFLLRGDFEAAWHMWPAIYGFIVLFTFIGVNHFVRIKFANFIINGLIILSVGLLLGNYILKFI